MHYAKPYFCHSEIYSEHDKVFIIAKKMNNYCLYFIDKKNIAVY